MTRTRIRSERIVGSCKYNFEPIIVLWKETVKVSVYIVTGATGYIGSMLIKDIAESEKEAEVVALVRDLKKAESILGNNVRKIKVDLTDKAIMNNITVKGDYILHCASVTQSSEMISHPVQVTESIVNTTQNVLELARRSGVKSMVYFSSMEVYGNIDCSSEHRVSEDELGSVSIFNVRSCYPLGKRMAENICYSYFKEYGVPVKIARLAQTFGKGVLPGDNRVYMQFSKAVCEGRDIVLKTQGTSMGNYCAIEDAIKGIWIILHKGKDGEVYNVVNEANTMRIRDMAELVATQIAGGRIQVKIEGRDNMEYGYAPDTGLRLSGEKLCKLGWQPKKMLVEMYQDVINELR